MRLTSTLSLGALLALAAFTPAPVADGEAYVDLSNESSTTLAFVYASTCDEDTWGEDLLPVDILEPGSEAVITVSPGCWDFKATTVEGQELEHFGIELEEGDEVAWTVTD